MSRRPATSARRRPRSSCASTALPSPSIVYDYVEHGGTAESARQLGVPEHEVVKTLVMQDERAQPLIVLMHGDRSVSLKNLARQIGCKKVEPCTPEVAQRHSGYQVGGTSPFGLRKAMPVFVEASVLALPRIHINGGRRGYLVGIEPERAGAAARRAAGALRQCRIDAMQMLYHRPRHRCWPTWSARCRSPSSSAARWG